MKLKATVVAGPFTADGFNLTLISP